MSHPAQQLPSIDRLTRGAEGRRLVELFGRTRVTAALKASIADARERLFEDEELTLSESTLLDSAERALSGQAKTLRSVLNLTGTVLHTNLGRAVLPKQALQAVLQVASGPSNLEFDLETGRRGDRDLELERLLQEITGAEAATVVNNNAAAVMLALNTLAHNRQVPVSRGELVEIGGSFRVPEIMAQSGCSLVEVGATNRTRLSDFEAAINEETALLMKVHTSNYQIQGFTESVTEKALSNLAHQYHLPFMTDLGSGTLVNLTRYNLPYEPTVQDALRSGADVVTFSGDKLLGGPQAGLIVGTRAAIDAIKKNPMKRALRVDKMTLAALTAVLKLYLTPEALIKDLPTLKDLSRPAVEIQKFGEALLPAAAAVMSDRFQADLVPTKSQIGSGALPIDVLPSWALAIKSSAELNADQDIVDFASKLRLGEPAIIGRIQDSQLLFDLRTLYDPAALLSALETVS